MKSFARLFPADASPISPPSPLRLQSGWSDRFPSGFLGVPSCYKESPRQFPIVRKCTHGERTRWSEQQGAFIAACVIGIAENLTGIVDSDGVCMSRTFVGLKQSKLPSRDPIELGIGRKTKGAGLVARFLQLTRGAQRQMLYERME
jgi:hypothetical protein